MSKVLLMIKDFGNWKKNMAIKATVLILLIAAVVFGYISVSYSDDVNKGLADNLIRLHVIANSDSERDQAMKEKVRDAILAYMKEELKDSQDLDQTRLIINRDMDRITGIAGESIKEFGGDYEVTATLGNYPFPTKAYGDITLPSGYYQALKVVIGKGEGSNWWCVLFPPLCFVDATHGTISESMKDELKTALSADEFSIITSAESDIDIPVQIRFKVVEFFQDSRIRFTGMISRLFKTGE